MEVLVELLVAAIGSGATLWFLQRRRARAAAEARAQKEAAWLRRMRQQKLVRDRLFAINEESLSLLEAMPGWVESAEHDLDRAELDFAEGAFAPFWNCVESAVVSLACFDESVRKLASHSCEYAELIAQCKTSVAPFTVSAVSPARMSLAASTSHRLHGIVRRAQRDFQFSVIYEHRKTNQILIAGFRNLSQAVEEMASSITASIDNLASKLETMKTPESTRAGESNREQAVIEMLERIEQTRYRTAIA